MTELDTIRGDLRYGLRSLARARGFTSTVLLILAAAVGASTALFSVLDGVLLRPLPVRDEADVVLIEKLLPADGNPLPFQQADVLAFAERTRTLEDIGGVQYDGAFPYQVRDGDRALTVTAAAVSGEFFRVLGVTPVLGRPLEPEDARPAAEPVLVISHGFWQRQFGGSADVLGRTLRGRSSPYTIVGVASPGLEYPRGTEAWIPLRADPDQIAARNFAVFSLIGRLAPGVVGEQARAEVTAFLREREAVYRSDESRGHSASVRPLREVIVGDVRPALLILFGAVLLVLLIANVNVSSLLLVRAAERGRELAVRAALGASRGRIVRQLLSEGAILAFAGALLGVLVAFWAVQLLLATAPAELPRASEIHVNARVLGFAVALAMATTLVFALAPALWASSLGVQTALRSGPRGGTDSRRMRLGKHVLVAAQIATALTVVIAAGLLVRSLARLERVDMGFAAHELTIARVPLQGEQYQDDTPRLAYFERLTERLAAIPGIEAATSVLITPFSGTGGWTAIFAAEGQSDSEAAANPGVNFESVLPNYFRTFGVPVRRGRGFSEDDRADAPPVAIVSERLAARVWPGQDPVGKRLKLGGPTSSEPWTTVVGVVEETRYRDLATPMPTLYLPARQSGPAPAVLAVRSSAPARAIAVAIRQAVTDIDPNERVYDVSSMKSLMTEPLARPRFTTLLLSGLALIALLLAATGLYGLMAALVAQRAHEIGVRRALGARPAHVRQIVVGRALAFTAAGALAGLAFGLIATRALRSILFEVSPADPVAIASAVALLAGTAALAGYVPLRRALRVDPARALRAE